MNEAEYADWRPRVEIEYAQDIIDAGIDEQAARDKAKRDFPALLPDGLATAGQDIYTVVEDGEPAGTLWLCERNVDTGRVLFVYDVRIYESRRGHGLGKAAMHFAEDEARRRGIDQVALNVFGGNDGARKLYHSLGYAEIAVYMTKSV
jgi:GNAT superfamily N-acetyltransferase